MFVTFWSIVVQTPVPPVIGCDVCQQSWAGSSHSQPRVTGIQRAFANRARLKRRRSSNSPVPVITTSTDPDAPPGGIRLGTFAGVNPGLYPYRS